GDFHLVVTAADVVVAGGDTVRGATDPDARASLVGLALGDGQPLWRRDFSHIGFVPNATITDLAALPGGDVVAAEVGIQGALFPHDVLSVFRLSGADGGQAWQAVPHQDSAYVGDKLVVAVRSGSEVGSGISERIESFSLADGTSLASRPLGAYHLGIEAGGDVVVAGGTDIARVTGADFHDVWRSSTTYGAQALAISAAGEVLLGGLAEGRSFV